MRIVLIAAALLVFAGAPLAQSDGAQNEALRQIEAFSTMQARTDPHFAKAEAAVLDQIDGVVKGSPPGEWLAAIRRLYFGASERLHREEREQIAAEELVAFVRPPSEDMTWSYFERRLMETSKALESGRWGPRGQALHALEAAKLYFPNDQSFLAYRQARVPLATTYEMGRISREEYDERWARAGEAFAARQQANDQARARLAVEAARGEAEILRAFQRPPPTTCTSQMVLGRLKTVCR